MLTRRRAPRVRPEPRQVLADVLATPRYEVLPLPGIEEKVAAHVPPQATVTVTASPRQGMAATLETAGRLASQGVQSVVLADLGKNVYAFVRGARCAGIRVKAIADDRLAGPRRRYRRIPVVTTDEGLGLSPDAVVVSNTSYVHATRRWEDLISHTSKPVLNWFEPPRAREAGAKASVGAAAALVSA